MLSVVESLERHPLPQLLAAGVKCSINADDPLLFGSGLLSEYEACRKQLGISRTIVAEIIAEIIACSVTSARILRAGLTDAALAACAAASFEHARCPEEVRRRGLNGVEAWLQTATAAAAL